MASAHPTIILDTTFKVYRGANQFYSAACDSLVPRQTSALAERDGPAMVRATWLAAGIVRRSGAGGLRRADPWRRQNLRIYCSAPRPSCRRRPRRSSSCCCSAIWRRWCRTACWCHTGFFKEVARISFALVAGQTGIAALAVWAHFDIIQFLNAYAAVYACGAIATVGLMIRGPIRLAHVVPGVPAVVPR